MKDFRGFSVGVRAERVGGQISELAGRWQWSGQSPFSFNSQVSKGTWIFIFQKRCHSHGHVGEAEQTPLQFKHVHVFSWEPPLPVKQISPNSNKIFYDYRHKQNASRKASALPVKVRVTMQLTLYVAVGKLLKPCTSATSSQGLHLGALLLSRH